MYAALKSLTAYPHHPGLHILAIVVKVVVVNIRVGAPGNEPLSTWILAQIPGLLQIALF